MKVMGLTQNVMSLGSYITVKLRFDITLWCKQLQLFVYPFIHLFSG